MTVDVVVKSAGIEDGLAERVMSGTVKVKEVVGWNIPPLTAASETV